MSAEPKRVELTEAELDTIVEWQSDMDLKYDLPFTANTPRVQDGVQLHHAGDFTGDVIDLVTRLVAAREAAARREALLEVKAMDLPARLRSWAAIADRTGMLVPMERAADRLDSLLAEPERDEEGGR